MLQKSYVPGVDRGIMSEEYRSGAERFETAIQGLRNGAKLILDKEIYKEEVEYIRRVVLRKWCKSHPENLTERMCRKFKKEHKSFPFHCGMVKAIMLEIYERMDTVPH